MQFRIINNDERIYKKELPLCFNFSSMNNIGFKIKRLREKRDVSQENLAYDLDISQSNLSRIENGNIEKVDFIFMQKVSDYFKVTPDYFLDDQIVQNNTENKASAITVYGNPTVNTTVPDEVLDNLAKNQEQITKLIEVQNRLIENLLKK